MRTIDGLTKSKISLWGKPPAKRIWQSGILFGMILRLTKITTLVFTLSIGVLLIGTLRQSSLGQKIQFFQLFKNGKYLILLENNSELRPAGGFIGSFAVATLKDAKINDLYFDTNIYRRDNQFVWVDKNQIPVPEPFKKMGVEWWAMRDSNWAVDFPQASQKVAWFYSQEGGENVDGVIALTSTVMIDLLAKLGPIEMPEYHTTITSENFLQTVQYKVDIESKTNPQQKAINEPKRILKDMLPKLIQKINQYPNKKEILDLVSLELREKQLALYFANPVLQKIVTSQNWGGQVQSGFDDYLNLNYANLGANKSSLNIKESWRYSIFPKPDNLAAQLQITRTHQGTAEWPDGHNLNWLRVLVPSGAKLLAASYNKKDITAEVKVASEAGKTVFGLWVDTPVGATDEIILDYQLPFTWRENQRYFVNVQKQIGSPGANLEIFLGDQLNYQGVLNQDKKIEIK